MTTYSISLDEVDLALLPVRSHRYNDFLKKEHYEFCVMARDGNTSDPQLYTCHTCSIDVPTAYTHEHWASAKHRANARIAAVAARRMRALVASPPPPPAPRPLARFCDSCATMVGGDHDKTKEHRIAVIHDRMLIDLMKVYVGDDDARENGCDEDPARNGDDRTVANISVNTVGNDAATERNADTLNDLATNGTAADNAVAIPKAPITDKANIEKPEETTDETQNIQNVIPNGTDTRDSLKIDAETYIKLLNGISDQPKIALKPSGDQIQIIVKNEMINVSNDNFHSYYRMNGKIQCRVCCENLNTETEDVHKLSKIHMERVSKVVTDRHCVREIYDNWSHCIICNQVMKTSTVNAHKYTKMHYDRKRDAIMKTTTENCHTKETLTNHQNPGTSGINKQSTPHQNSQNKADFKAKWTKNSIEDEIEHPYKRTQNPLSVFCVVCECDVPMKLSNRVDHLKGMRHAYSLKNAKHNVKDNA